MSGAWGLGPWGGGAWGGGVGLGFSFSSYLAYRENVFRFEFSGPIYFSRILDPPDGSDPRKWMIAPVVGTTGLDGNPARALQVISVVLPGVADGVDAGDIGRFVDVITDRPMTPHPAMYDVTFTNITSADLSTILPVTTTRAAAVYKRVQPPSMDANMPMRDLANPMTRSAMIDSPLPNPNNPLNLGAITVDDTGDYAFDEGLVNLKKRVIRRLITKKSSFAHLPGYGVSVLEQGKKLAIPSIIANLAADAESQISREPDVSKVRVIPVIDPNTPGLVRFQVYVRPRSGPTQRFDVPFPT